MQPTVNQRETAMTLIKTISDFLDGYAPPRLAEDWDNVGLLVGDASQEVDRLMTCLTVTPESVAEAIKSGVGLIVSHHPLPFRPLKRLTTEQTASKLLWDLIRAGVAIYSPHTGFDSAAGGINQSLATRIGLRNIHPLIPMIDDTDGLGSGRIGDCQRLTLGDWIESLKQNFSLSRVQFVGDRGATVSKVAIACGSGGSFLEAAIEAGCDAFLTGETNFHTCLEARARNVSLALLGHYASERFAVEMLANVLAEQFPEIEVWASGQESDPLSWG